ncbi:MAG TPA: hypothetical protein VHK65_16825 [Candidatus Dormibacteraeota bacterium]|nr:hypothetical protein [Candidatus Dormibacteraeota bacterium]
MIDKSKLPAGLWVRTVWAPEPSTDPDDRPIALVTDRRRFWISAIPMLLAFLVGTALALFNAPRLLLFPALLVFGLSYQYGLRGRTGFYEVSEDGSLGDFLGRRVPPGLTALRRSKP